MENRTRRLVKRRSVYVYGVRFCTLLHRGNYIYRRSANGAERNKSFLLLKKNSESIKRANFCTVSPEKESIYGACVMYVVCKKKFLLFEYLYGTYVYAQYINKTDLKLVG